MVGLTFRSLAGVTLLLSASVVARLQGQEAPRRLPPCNAVLAYRTQILRIPPVVQATAIEPIPNSELARPDSLLSLEPERVPPFEQPNPGVDSLPPPMSYEAEFLVEEYLIQPGDELEIKFRFTPELNETVVVRPDGLISLQVVGAVMAADRTPRELHAELVHAFTPALKNPLIVVHVRRFAGNHVFVGGEVSVPAHIPIPGQMSVLQAIIRAGGFKDTADERRVILRREGGYSVTLNLKADIRGRVIGNDVLLRPYDVIYVPKSRIAKVNLWVDQYIQKLLPFQSSTGIFISREGSGSE